ncbi:MAG: mechanosensitive ion channel family protein [Coriobacteriales bacterium]|nr:mechanosensitive ion channel family protein [Coriobacteriales bacterium]
MAIDAQAYETTLSSINNTVVDLVSAAIVVVGAYLLSRWITSMVRRTFGDSSVAGVTLILNIVRAILVGGAAYFVAENVFDIELSGLVQAFGITTLVVTLSMQELMVNVVAGIQILVTKLFSVGDQIEVDGVRGEVLDINWRQTVIRDKDNDPHVIPNSQLMNKTFMRRDGKMAQRYTIELDIKPGLDLDRIAADIEHIADEVLTKHGWKAEEDSEVRFIGSTANGVRASVRIFMTDIAYTTRGQDAVMRAIGQRGYLADWTNDDIAQEQWR